MFAFTISITDTWFDSLFDVRASCLLKGAVSLDWFDFSISRFLFWNKERSHSSVDLASFFYRGLVFRCYFAALEIRGLSFTKINPGGWIVVLRDEITVAEATFL